MSEWKVLFQEEDFDGCDEYQLEEYDNFDSSWIIVAKEEPVEVVLQSDGECIVDHLDGYTLYACPAPDSDSIYIGTVLKEEQDDDIILPDSLMSLVPLEFTDDQWLAIEEVERNFS